MLNKEIASSLGVGIRTIEQRRRRISTRLGVHHPAKIAQRILDVTKAPIKDSIQNQNAPLRPHLIDFGAFPNPN